MHRCIPCIMLLANSTITHTHTHSPYNKNAQHHDQNDNNDNNSSCTKGYSHCPHKVAAYSQWLPCGGGTSSNQCTTVQCMVKRIRYYYFIITGESVLCLIIRSGDQSLSVVHMSAAMFAQATSGDVCYTCWWFCEAVYLNPSLLPLPLTRISECPHRDEVQCAGSELGEGEIGLVGVQSGYFRVV